MARISELHYSNAYAASSGVSEFLEVALDPSEDPADFTVSFYQASGQVGVEVTLDQPGVQLTVDPETGENVYVISADAFNIRLTDPDGSGSNNYEAFALTETGVMPASVIDFYDIGGGTQSIAALNGAAAGSVSENLPVLVSPGATTTSLQFNQPDEDQLTYAAVSPGDTGIVCFAAGTELDTPTGPRRIETLRPGDLLMTLDHGARPLRWIGRTTGRGFGSRAPVRFAPGVWGATRPVYVSPQHRVLVCGWQAQLMFDATEVLVPAHALCDGHGVRQCPAGIVTYVHVLMDRHEILSCQGFHSESFFPGAAALAMLNSAQRADLLHACPNARAPHTYGALARPSLSRIEGTVLAA